MRTRKLWLGFLAVIIGSFAVLLYYGYEIYREAPPVPEQVVTTDGTILFTGQDIKDGQNVWQSLGGHQLGTIWGHGAYQAPDWSADWLHREAVYILDRFASESDGMPFESLDEERKAALQVRLQKELRTITFNQENKTITISPIRAEAIAEISVHYGKLFTDDPEVLSLREAYGIQENALKDPERVRLLNAFFFWTS